MSKWKMVKLGDVCRPKQWKTISSKELTSEGYPVYGANGQIGFYHKYTHVESTLLITCRGATSGSINISKPFSYVNGNAMALDNLSNNLNMKFLMYYFKYRKFDDVISGSAQPQIVRNTLENIKIPIPPLKEQKRIVNELDKINNLIEKRKSQIEKLDLLVKAKFIEMFGDPVTNPMGWEQVILSTCLEKIENGKSFVCNNYARVNNEHAVLKLSAVTYGIYLDNHNKLMIDKTSFLKKAEVKVGDLLFTRKNTPELVGMSAYVFSTMPNLMMPDLIFRLVTNNNCNKIYLWKLINHTAFRNEIANLATGSSKSMSNISKERLNNLLVHLPPRTLQNQFANYVLKVEESKTKMEQGLIQLESLYQARMQEYFGE